MDIIETDPFNELVNEAEVQLKEIEIKLQKHKQEYDACVLLKRKWDAYLKQLKVAENLQPSKYTKRKRDDDEYVPTQKCSLVSEI